MKASSRAGPGTKITRWIDLHLWLVFLLQPWGIGALPGLSGPPWACLSSDGGVGRGVAELKYMGGGFGPFTGFVSLCLADAEGSPLFPGKVGAVPASVQLISQSCLWRFRRIIRIGCFLAQFLAALNPMMI